MKQLKKPMGVAAVTASHMGHCRSGPTIPYPRTKLTFPELVLLNERRSVIGNFYNNEHSISWDKNTYINFLDNIVNIIRIPFNHLHKLCYSIFLSRTKNFNQDSITICTQRIKSVINCSLDSVTQVVAKGGYIANERYLDCECFIQAIKSGQLSEVEALLNNPLSHKYLNVTGENGSTALHLLAAWGLDEITLKYASTPGCDLSCKTSSGLLASQVAENNSHPILAMRLRELEQLQLERDDLEKRETSQGFTLIQGGKSDFDGEPSI